jgi:hypothetical protein
VPSPVSPSGLLLVLALGSGILWLLNRGVPKVR